MCAISGCSSPARYEVRVTKQNGQHLRSEGFCLLHGQAAYATVAHDPEYRTVGLEVTSGARVRA